MESNKEEAIRCIDKARTALASGDKERALRFIRIAKRLNPNVSVDAILAACENLGGCGPSLPSQKSSKREFQKEPGCSNFSESSNFDRCYTDEHVELIQGIKSRKDYYAILGVDKSCSTEDIRRAYKKLSLKVHPDKNKAPGADEAFKIISKAFMCLSDEGTRRQYDQVDLVEENEFNHQSQVRRRRRRPVRPDFSEEDFYPNEMFTSFFYGSQNNVFNVPRAYMPRRNAPQERECDHGGRGLNLITMLNLVLIIVFVILLSYPFSEPHYSLQKTHTYQVPKATENHAIEYFVKSSEFDHQFPQGSTARNTVENSILRDYKSVLNRYCHMELQRRHWVRDYPTPHCDRLRSLL
ncbi:hypothetical protein HPP92_006922 [Vanilla planifolia]|uniref:J domain-containing protein n=1 Tax=Vanilla planifolia TaxID=51239 RepID=A0A835V9K4_VANPL|nr:hypothetical protein HPP92_006922 [Vanilla planifolia]